MCISQMPVEKPAVQRRQESVIAVVNYLLPGDVMVTWFLRALCFRGRATRARFCVAAGGTVGQVSWESAGVYERFMKMV